MIISINQPAYLPWLGYFDRITQSDVHVVLDHVQFEKNSFTNRNRVRMGGDAVWLTVPVRTGGRFGELAITDIEVPDGHWRRKHWQTLTHCYGRTPHFSALAPVMDGLYQREWPRLAPLLRESTQQLCAILGIRTPIVYSSDLLAKGAKGDLVLDICRRVGAHEYLSGPLGRNYLDPTVFEAAGIALKYHDYDHPVYAQSGPGFKPYLSIVDLLFNHGSEALHILSRGAFQKEIA